MRCIRRNQVSGLVVARGILLRLPRRIPIALFYLYLLFSITACSFDKDSSTRAAAAPPPAKQEVIAPIPTAMDTFRALAPPDGLKFTPLFNENVTDTNARIKRLEDAVQTIRNDVDTLVPTIVREVAIEKDIKGLVAQLQTLTDQGQQGQAAPAGTPSKLPPPLTDGGTKIPGEDVAKGTEPAKADEAKAGPAAPSSLVTPEAAPAGELPPKGAASPNSIVPAGLQPQGLNLNSEAVDGAPENETEAAPQPSVVNLRIADYKEKTQLILDVTEQAPVKTKLVNQDKTLVIDLAQIKWLGKDTWESDHKKLISGGYVKEGKLYVSLNRASQFKAEELLPPSGEEKNYRLVINLFNKKVQKAAAPKAKAHAPVPTSPAPAAVPAPKTTGEDFP